jgi:RNA polymerase III transcription factor (TF)IIIC subunit HTH domain
MCSYIFQEGPWRDTVIRIGYDPRQDPQAVMYASRFVIPVKETAKSLQGIRLLPCAMSEIQHSVLLSSRVVVHKQSRKEMRACNELIGSVDVLIFSVARIHSMARRQGLLVPSSFVISQIRLSAATLMTLATGSTPAQ